MKRIFFGHRGVGKTELLKRHQSYFPDVDHYDLDQEIANHAAQSVSEFFANHGEAEFRKLEAQIFNKIIQKGSFVIAVGGGFDVSTIPSIFERIYVSRRTDKDGRIFLYRPRLNPEMDSLEEYQYRYRQREPAFLEFSDWVYEMSEGITASDIENEVFKEETSSSESYVTLQPDHLKLLEKFKSIELRTDIFSNEEILEFLKRNNRFMVSIRNEKGKSLLPLIKDRCLVDWALEHGVPSEAELTLTSVVSTHNESLAAALQELEPYKFHHLKLCPIVKTWEELQIGYEWQKKESNLRSFLPRTDPLYGESSVWRWFREYMLPFQKLNFISQYSKIQDQPCYFETLLRLSQDQSLFSAVIGWPIEHSRTPGVHNGYFNHSTLAIPLDEMNFEIATKFLISLGLKTTAVTSPLKNLASDSTGVMGCNSISFFKDWIGRNTDILAIDTICQDYLSTSDQVAVWGGGGVIERMRDDYPQFLYFSSREGTLRSHSESSAERNIETSPTVVIWAAPRTPATKMPPPQWTPRLVIDFNYVESSMGLEYTLGLKNKVNYVSGLEFFRLQAAEQIKFFKQNLERAKPS